MTDIKKYTWETKCRRCSTIKEWFFSDANAFEYKDFQFAMNDHIDVPRLMYCDSCLKDTVQDVVSYTNSNK